MKLRVEVTAEDIAIGKAEDCKRCPIARAIKRVETRKDGTCFIAVDSMYVSFRTPDGRHMNLTTPIGAAMFIKRFDDGLPVSPFSFELDISPERHVPSRVHGL